MFTLLTIIAWEVTTFITGALNVPTWLDNLYNAVIEFWHL